MATRRRVSTFRAKVQEELICAICLDFLQEPKILSCAHSFCQRCLSSIVNTGSSYKYGPNGKLAKDEVECPSCREITSIPGGKVNELKTNYNLKTLVNIVSEHDKKIARDAIHSRKHTRPSIRVGKAPSLCKFHGRQLEYYCLECFEPLCPKCIGTGHKGHDFKDIDEVLPDVISSLRALIQPACEVNLKAESTLKWLLEEKDKATLNQHVTTDSIKACFEKMRKMLNQREKALLATTHKYVDIKLTRLDVHYQALEQHHNLLLDQVTAIEKLVEGNDNVSILQQQQSISEDLEVHEQSIMSLCDMLSEAQTSASLLFQVEDVKTGVSTLGDLNECHIDPNSKMEIERRRVLISEEDDPYLDVPLRFEDLESKSPQEEMRFEHSLNIEYEPENKPKAESLYDTPKPVTAPKLPLQCSNVSSKKPVPPPRKQLPNTIRRGKCVLSTSQNDNLIASKPPAVLSRSSSLAVKHYDRPSHKKPAPKYSHYDVPKFASLPLHFSRELTKPCVQHRSEAKQLDDVGSSSDEYEPLDDIVCPSPAPHSLPPPIPPNHPSSLKKFKPIPKPRKRSGTEAISTSSIAKQNIKRRSNTLPLSPDCIGNLLEDRTILTPVMVMSSQMLSSPNSQESVYPVGICCSTDSEDTIIITDAYNHCVRKFNSNGIFLAKIGKEGRSGGQFKEPSAVTVDARNHMYVSERDNPRVQKFSSSGKYVSKFGHKTLLGSQLNDPMGIAMSPNGCVVVSDWDKGHILFFTSDGKLVNTLGKYGEMFKFPAGITFNSSGNLFVVDRGNHCVWILSPNGEIIQKFSRCGSNNGELYYPYGIAVTDHNIVVSESGNNRVSIFTLTGKFVRCFGSYGSKPGMFDHPRHICVNSKGQLLVADEMNQRVQVFLL